MTEQINNSVEKSLAQMDGLVGRLYSEGKVDETVDPLVIREALENLGANFEISTEAKASLRDYTNAGRRKGLQEVWGERLAEFKSWINEEFIPHYEAKVGRELPTLFDPKTGKLDDIKYCGMR